MTLREAYRYGQEQLKNAKVEDAELDAWYLLEFVTGISRAQYFLDSEKQLSLEEEQEYLRNLKLRTEHIPLQHITGVQMFMGLEFKVNEHVLIPRQDTEVLVEKVLDVLQPGMQVLDMCTGSGCILLSLLHGKKDVTGVGVDLSEEALKVAKQNAESLEIEATFLQSDLFAKVEGTYDLIVSNPPYIRTEVIEGLQEEVRMHDPRMALDGKEDGLYFYKKIIEKSPSYLKRSGRVYFEIGHDQGEDVKKLMEDAGFQEVTVKKDLAGLDRVVYGVYI